MDSKIIKSVVDSADRDGDGKLSKAELAILFGSVTNVSFDEFDTDKDGRLSLDECVKAVEKVYSSLS